MLVIYQFLLGFLGEKLINDKMTNVILHLKLLVVSLAVLVTADDGSIKETIRIGVSNVQKNIMLPPAIPCKCSLMLYTIYII